MLDKHQLEGIDKSEHGKLIDMMQTAFRSVEIAGKNVIQSTDGEFLEYMLMEEEYFVETWLSQFAAGHIGERNYFNQRAWGEITQQFTKGVIVLNKEMQPVVLIRKFIDMDLSFEQQQYLDQYARMASQAKYIPDPREVDQIVTGFSDIVVGLTAQNPDYDTLTGLVPYQYYLDHGIDPVVVKQVLYIRDTYNYNGESLKENDEVMGKVETILYKHQRGQGTTPDERAFIDAITNGEFIFDGNLNGVDNDQPSAPAAEEEFDPLA